MKYRYSYRLFIEATEGREAVELSHSLKDGVQVDPEQALVSLGHVSEPYPEDEDAERTGAVRLCDPREFAFKVGPYFGEPAPELERHALNGSLWFSVWQH